MNAKSSPNLTIVIPTFDRPAEVNDRLREVDLQWKDAVIVCVQVNPGTRSAATIDASLCRGDVTVRENVSNVGFVANVVIGLQPVKTKWVWILGDDDVLDEHAKSRIDAAIGECEASSAEAAVFNHWYRSPFGHSVVCRDLKTFCRATGFGDALFISGTIWRTCHIRSHLEDCVLYAYSCSSHILPHIKTLTSGGSPVVVVDEKLINYRSVQRWSHIEYLDQVLILLRHPAVRPQAGLMTDFMGPTIITFLSAALGKVRTGEVTFFEVLRVYLIHLGNVLRHRPFRLFARSGILLWPLKQLIWRRRGSEAPSP